MVKDEMVLSLKNYKLRRNKIPNRSENLSNLLSQDSNEFLDSLEFYISLLDDTKAEIIRQYYFHEKKLDEISKALGLSLSAVNTQREIAINRLFLLYHYVKKGRENPQTPT